MLIDWLQDETVRRVMLISWALVAVASAFVLRKLHLLPLSERGSRTLIGALGYMDKRTAWLLMESPVLIAVLAGFLSGPQRSTPAVVIVGAFVAHYVNRALIYPFRIRASGRRMPRLTVLAVMGFYLVNG
ncbi:MAG: hypothetical protein D6761_13980, partial [Candidatus Dadabacteria bacterium]